jgi:hypothetical protein
MMGRRTSSQPWALWTLPGRSLDGSGIRPFRVRICVFSRVGSAHGSGATTLTWSMESLLTVLAAAQLLLCGVAFSRESSLRIFRIEIPVRFSPV